MLSQSMFRRRRTAGAAAAVAVALVVAGCTATEAPDSSASSFTLMFSSPSAQVSPYERLAEAYMEEFPERTIELNRQPIDQYDTTLRTQLQAGNASDLAQTAPGSGQLRSVVALAEAGFLAPLPESSAALIPAGSEGLFDIDGVAYGQPLDFTVTGAVTNLTALEGFGIDEYPTDYDDFLAACETAAEQGKSMIVLPGIGGPLSGYLAMVISATRVYADAPDWNAQRAAGEVTFAESDGWIETLETVQELLETGCFQAGVEGAGLDVTAPLLSANEAASYFAPGVVSVELASAAPEETEWSIQAFPPADGGTPFVLASSNFSLSITKDAENPEAAQAFLDWLAAPEQGDLYMEVSGTLPVSGYADMDLNETIYAPVADLLASGQTAPLPINTWPNPRVFEALLTGVQGMLIGQGSPETVLAAMDAAWDE